jgi:predicted CopG family antitoxin
LLNAITNIYELSFVYKVMITTIQISSETKKILDEIKSNKETYEQLILKLLLEKESKRKEFEELLAEGYTQMAEENLKIEKEFEKIENSREWEW